MFISLPYITKRSVKQVVSFDLSRSQPHMYHGVRLSPAYAILGSWLNAAPALFLVRVQFVSLFGLTWSFVWFQNWSNTWGHYIFPRPRRKCKFILFRLKNVCFIPARLWLAIHHNAYSCASSMGLNSSGKPWLKAHFFLESGAKGCHHDYNPVLSLLLCQGMLCKINTTFFTFLHHSK